MILTKNEQAAIVNYAMMAECELYNRYFINGLIKRLRAKGAAYTKAFLSFIRIAGPCTFRLYCELMLKGMFKSSKQAVSYKV